MNCYLLGTLLDEHFEHALDAETEAALLAHLTTCADCAAPYERERRLRRSLQALPVPAPAPGFAERVLARAAATRSERPAPLQRWGAPPVWLAGGALVASFAVAIGLWSMRQPVSTPDTMPVAHVQPSSIAGVQPVRLVFRSASALDDVTIELVLPEGVELDGYPGQRRLVWQSDLRAGSNLLELPVLVHGPGGVLTATLNHGAERRQFSARIVPARPRTTFVSPRRAIVDASAASPPVTS